MALLDAKEYDPRPRQRLIRLIVAAVVVAILAVVGYFMFRYQGEKNAINNFFAAVEAKNFEKAYGIYNADPDWKQHPEKYSNYSYNQFYLDWGPQGDYGVINAHHIDCVVEPKARNFQSPSGVIVVVRINNRADRTESLWVEKRSDAISEAPDKAYCGGSTT
jgi:Tfp pilus assembly protein PilE